MARYRDPGSGFRQDETEFIAGVSQQEFSFFLNQAVGASGKVEAYLGSSTVTATFRPAVPAAALVQGVMTTTGPLWADGPDIEASLQARAADGGYQTSGGQLVLEIELKGAGVEKIRSGLCKPNAHTGICNTMTVTVPAAWFQRSGIVLVHYGLTSGPLKTFSDEIMLMAIGSSIESQTRGDVALEVPRRNLFRGERFLVHIYGHGGSRAVSTWSLTCVTSAGELDILSASSPAVWDIATSGSASRKTVTGKPTDPKSRPQGDTDGNDAELLVVLQVQVSRNAMEGGLPSISCDVAEFLNGRKSNPMTATGSTNAFVYDRDGSGRRAAVVHIIADDVIGVLVSAERAVLLNTAVLSGKEVRSGMSLYAARRSGTVGLVTLGLTCTVSASDRSILKLDKTTCGNVYLDGTETSGSASVTVDLGLVSPALSAQLVIHVWYPSVPVAFQMSDAQLNRINGLTQANAGGDCTLPVYQGATLSCYTTFSDGAATTGRLDVTSLVLPQVVIAPSSVASATGAHVQGLSPGSFTISVTGQQAASFVPLTVLVTNELANVMHLEISVVESLSISGVPTVAGGGAFTAGVQVLTTLDTEFQRASVFTEALFDDGSKQELAAMHGLAIQSRNEDVMQVLTNTSVQAVGSFQGMLMEGRWNNPCNGELIGVGVGLVDNQLPQPDGVIVTVAGNGRIAQVGGVAAKLGGGIIATELKVQVWFTFKDGRRQDMTNDRRTVYNASVEDPLDVFRLTKRGNVVLVTSVAGEDGIGFGVLHVSFTHVNLTQTTTVHVVAAESLAINAHPFPVYPSSDSDTIADLRVIAETAVRQSAVLSLVLTLTDKTSYPVSTTADASYMSSSPAVVRVGTSKGKNIVLALVEGTAVISGSFAGMQSNGVAPINVLSQKATVTSYTQVTFPPTLRGVRNVGQAQLRFGVILSDGRQYPRDTLFPSSLAPPILPNLVQFSTSEPSRADASATSGVVTLLENFHALVSVIAVAITPSGANGVRTDVQYFACNEDPAEGDIDLGQQMGIALGPVNGGATLFVAVRVNTGSHTAASIQLSVDFDAECFEVINMARGLNLGTFNFNAAENPGTVTFGSSGASLKGVALMATIELRVKNVSSTLFASIGGTVITLADGSGNLIPTTA